MKNVAASRMNTSEIAAVVRSDAMNMYAVKMPHAIRNSPTAWLSIVGFVMSLAKNCRNAQNESQNPPNELNATAPNVLPVRNSHMPASSWAMPPYASATPRTTGTVPGPLADSPVWPNVPALAALSRNVVSAKAASPSGPGSAGDHAPVTSAAGAGSRRSGSRLPMAADSITLSFLQARASLRVDTT